jgi:hypothetical protein
MDRFMEEIASLFIAGYLHPLHQFEQWRCGHVILLDQRQQQHETVRAKKSFEGQAFNNLSSLLELNPIVVPAARVARSTNVIPMNQSQTLQPRSSTRVFAGQPLDPAILNARDELITRTANPPNSRMARHLLACIHR